MTTAVARKTKLLLILSSALLLSACGQSSSRTELTKYVDDILLRPGAKIEPLPTFAPYKPYHYSSDKLRSPFEPPRKASKLANNLLEPDTKRPREELENFGLDSLRMVGTLAQGKVLWALIAAPNGGVYKVSVGNYVGKNYGKVTNIDNQGVKIVETIQDGQGGWMQQPSALDLSTKEQPK